VRLLEDIPQVYGGISAQESFHRVLKQLVSSLGHSRYPARQARENLHSSLVANDFYCASLETDLIP
jgi:hypothetical protein